MAAPAAMSACARGARWIVAPACLAAALATHGSAAEAASLGPGGGHPSASLAYCDAGQQLDAGQRDVLLRFAAAVKEELARSGAGLALIARSGLDLRRFGQRYSHAGITLAANPESPWAVRQLYYACDEKAPRLFDQGMSAFLMGTDDAAEGYVSIVFLPAPAAARLEASALDKQVALALLGASYSANAYPFSTRHQNCNQWLAELLAWSWGAPLDATPPAATAADDARLAVPARVRAQQWLQAAGYAPTVFDLGASPLLLAAAFVPWLHLDDHPAADLERNRLAVSMPAAIEAFVRRRLPDAERIELCHDSRQVVLRRGWQPIADGCRPGPGDVVRPLP